MNIHAVYKHPSRYFRSRRKELFHRVMQPSPRQTIMDVGGYHWFWETMGCSNPITCLNLNVPNVNRPLPSQFTYVQGDGRSLPFEDNEYDIVFSNSVIEHVGSFGDQKRFAAEIRRVGKSCWVQTPNRRFFVEPHLATPFIHFLPKTLQRRMLRRWTVWGIVARPTRLQVDAFLSEVRLLSEHEMRELFPGADILSERFLGFKKSFVAVKTATATS